MATGFVTTTRVTHATPAALYSHSPNRDWECDSAMPESARKCLDIGRQLVEQEPGNKLNVIMGGGRQCLMSNAKGTKGDPLDKFACQRKDGRNLIKTWKQERIKRCQKYAVVGNRAQLKRINPRTEFVMGES